MMRISVLTASAALMAVTLNLAEAQNVSGFYIGGGAGVSDIYKTTWSVFPTTDSGLTTPSNSLERDWKLGYVGVLSLGYGFGNGLRAEIEGAYRTYETDSAKAFNRTTNGGGTNSSYAAMANLLYDIDLRMIGLNTQAVVPYLGVGAGYAITEWSSVRGNAGTNTQLIDGTDGTFAYQGIAGLSFPIDAVPGLSITAEYRYFGTPDPNFDVAVKNTATGSSRPQSIPVATHNHNALIGLRYAFGAAPAVVAAAPVAAAKTYLVFFDWNKADLTDRAKQIIGEAATARAQGVTRIEVNGYTDRSGSDQYNQGLSVRRANAVAAELVRRGVPRNEIATRGFGEANPLVPTADGVREPQNRRVEIILK